jgi:hypothetical protein
MDTATNVANLGKAAIGYPYSKITGNPVPSALEASDPETVIGTSAWFKKQIRDFGGGNLIDATGDPSNPDLGSIHGAAEAVGPVGVAGAIDSATGAIGAARAAAARSGATGVLSTDAGEALAAAKTAAQVTHPIEQAPRVITPKIDPAAVEFDASGVAKAPAPAPEATPPTVAPTAEAPFARAAPDSTLLSAALPQATQDANAATLKAIGLQEARVSAIEGHVKNGASDYQTSQLDEPVGQRATAVINNEQQALHDYSANLVDNTGGRIGTDLNSDVSRGSTILKPFEDLGEHLDAEIKAQYDLARKKANGQPIDTPALQTIVGDESNFLGTDAGEALLKGIKSRVQKTGMVAADGTIRQATVNQIEDLRQWLGTRWTHENARFIQPVKDAMGRDVTKAAGEDIFLKARAANTKRADTLDNPNGVAKLLDSSGPNGINRAVSVEKIPQTLANLSVAQFKHVVGVLKDDELMTTPALKATSAEALKAIKSHFATQVQEAGAGTQGAWKNKAVADYLNDNNAKMQLVFNKQELQGFSHLNEAGRILHIDRHYPGAAAQTANLTQRGITLAGEHATAVGALAGHIPGAIVGAGVKAVTGKRVSRSAREDSQPSRAQAVQFADSGNAV